MDPCRPSRQFLCCEIVPQSLRQFCREEEFRAGELLVRAGQPIHEVGFILSGSANGLSFLPSGEVLEPFWLDAEYGVLGLAELLNERPTMQFSVAAAEQTRVLFLPADIARKQLLNNASSMRSYARMLTSRVARDNLRNTIYYKSITQKFCYYLCYCYELAGAPQEGVCIRHSYRQIAAQLGLSTQSVYRASRRFTEEGLVGRRGRQLFLSRAQYAELKSRLDG